MTYEHFSQSNEQSKNYFSQLMNIKSVDFGTGVCTVNYGGRVSCVSIDTIVRNVMCDGLGALDDTEPLKRWEGFN